MKLVLPASQDDEPVWDCFSTTATDFRPHWDGDLVNVFTTIRPQRGFDETKQFAIACARELASWLVENRHRFTKGDRFQFIVAWTKDVRLTARQIIKTGGDWSVVEAIGSGSKEIQMHGKNWAGTVFETTYMADNPQPAKSAQRELP